MSAARLLLNPATGRRARCDEMRRTDAGLCLFVCSSLAVLSFSFVCLAFSFGSVCEWMVFCLPSSLACICMLAVAASPPSCCPSSSTPLPCRRRPAANSLEMALRFVGWPAHRRRREKQRKTKKKPQFNRPSQPARTPPTATIPAHSLHCSAPRYPLPLATEQRPLDCSDADRGTGRRPQ